MKKSTIFFVSLLCLLFFSACKLGPGDFTNVDSRSFVLFYENPQQIKVSVNKAGGLSYWVNFAESVHCGINSEGEKLEKYNALCEKYRDVSYNREVRYYPGYRSACALSFIGLKVISTDAWDEGHAANTNLGDIVHFQGYTPLPYIRSGYTKKYSEKEDGEYYPIDKLVSELTQDDMTLLSAGGFALRFTHAPTASRQHTLTFTLTDDEGREYTTSLDVDFDALDPQ